MEGASGRGQGRVRGFKKREIKNYETYPRGAGGKEVHRELKWPVQFLVQNNVAFQLKDVHY